MLTKFIRQTSNIAFQQLQLFKIDRKIIYEFAKPLQKQQNKKLGQINESSLQQLMINYLHPEQKVLSTQQQIIITQEFEDLSLKQKQMLDLVAEKIVKLPTNCYYQLMYQKEGLGTQEMLTVISEPNQEGLEDKIMQLTKEY